MLTASSTESTRPKTFASGLFTGGGVCVAGATGRLGGLGMGGVAGVGVGVVGRGKGAGGVAGAGARGVAGAGAGGGVVDGAGVCASGAVVHVSNATLPTAHC